MIVASRNTYCDDPGNWAVTAPKRNTCQPEIPSAFPAHLPRSISALTCVVVSIGARAKIDDLTEGRRLQRYGAMSSVQTRGRPDYVDKSHDVC